MDNSNKLSIASLPPEPVDLSDRIRSSCQQCQKTHQISIDESACDEFLLNLNLSTYKSRSHAPPTYEMRFPLQFSSQLAEINVIGMVGLLECLDAHDMLLKKRTGRGARETAQYFVLGAYLQSANAAGSIFTARGMIGVTPSDLSTSLNLPLHVERPIGPDSPISITEPDPEVTQLIADLILTFHSTGKVLQDLGFPDFGSFLLARVSLSSSELIRQLAGAFPAFREMYILDGQPVYFFRKALFLSQALQQKHLPFPKLKSLQALLVDDKLTVMLLQLGLIDASHTAGKSLLQVSEPSLEWLISLPHRSATILRASSLTCFQTLIERLHSLKQQANSCLAEVDQDGLSRYLINSSQD